MQAILRQLRNSRLRSSAQVLFCLAFLSLTALICQPSPLSAGTIFVASGKIESWKLILDGGQGSGNCTLIKAENGTVTADGDWSYNYQGANVSGTYSGASVTITGLSISITASGTANNPSAPPGYQTSPFTLSISGKAYNAHGSGTFTLTFTTPGWPPSIPGTWKGTRTSGSGITRVIGIPSTLLLND